MWLLSSAGLFQNYFFQNSFRNMISVKMFDPDQDRHSHNQQTKKVAAHSIRIFYRHPYPAIIVCTKNVVCLIHLLHIFKCIPGLFYHGSHHYEPIAQGGTLIFSYIPRLRPFFGVQNFELGFKILNFWGFSEKNKIF